MGVLDKRRLELGRRQRKDANNKRQISKDLDLPTGEKRAVPAHVVYTWYHQGSENEVRGRQSAMLSR